MSLHFLAATTLVALCANVVHSITFRVALPDWNAGWAVRNWIPKFEQESGHVVETSMFSKFDDLTLEIETELGSGSTIYGAYVYPIAYVSNFGDHLHDLTQKVSSAPNFQFHDVAAFYRNAGLMYQQKIVAAILDGDFHMFHHRKDILHRDGRAAPSTLEELVELATKYNGTDLNDDGMPDYGLCIIWFGADDFWNGEFFMSYVGGGFQTKGTHDGVWFDTSDLSSLLDSILLEDMATQLKHAMRNGSDWGAMRQFGWDVRHVFNSGRCFALLDWMDIPIMLTTKNMSNPHLTHYDSLTLRPWVASPGPNGTSRVASVAPPGHKKVWNRDLKRVQSCDRSLCPYTDEGGANRPVFAANGGWGIMVNGAISQEVFEAVWEFLAFGAGPEQSMVDVLDGTTGYEPYRYSQLHWQLWERQGMNKDYAQQLFSETMPDVFNSPNLIQEPPLPGAVKYHTAVGRAFRRFVEDEIDVSQMRESIAKDWEQLHTENGGRAEQLKRYRTGLGLPSLDDDAELTDMTSSSTLVYLLAVIVGVFLLTFLISFVCWVVYSIRQKYRLQRRQAALRVARVNTAIEALETLAYPLVILAGRGFAALHELLPYEKMRDQRADLVYLDSLDSIREFKLRAFVIFFSHQWLCWTSPDPDCVQLDCMKAALPKLVESHKQLSMDNTFVWLDYISIPQASKQLQGLAIQSISSYAAAADAFIIIAPQAKHFNTEVVCDVNSYEARGWCRVEMFAKMCSSGGRQVFVLDSPTGELKNYDLDEASLKVFDGAFACCEKKSGLSQCEEGGLQGCDKEKLVLPMLGLYLLAKTHRDEELMRTIWEKIEAERNEYFPKAVRTHEAKNEQELFGPLLHLMDEKLQENEDLGHQPIIRKISRQDVWWRTADSPAISAVFSKAGIAATTSLDEFFCRPFTVSDSI